VKELQRVLRMCSGLLNPGLSCSETSFLQADLEDVPGLSIGQSVLAQSGLQVSEWQVAQSGLQVPEWQVAQGGLQVSE
jgi:hypothetical protein